MFLIAMCGGSASGKSRIISLLKEHFKEDLSVIDMDNYYYSHDELSYEERKQINYDVPESLDIDKIIEDIEQLKKGSVVEQPFFSFQTYRREQKTEKTKPAKILIVDGIFSLHFEKLRKMYDLKIFVDVDSEVRFARRIVRNMKLYQRPVEFEVEQWFTKVKPMYEKYVEPCRQYGDLILPFYENNKSGLAFLIEIIENRTSVVKTEKEIDDIKIRIVRRFDGRT